MSTARQRYDQTFYLPLQVGCLNAQSAMFSRGRAKFRPPGGRGAAPLPGDAGGGVGTHPPSVGFGATPHSNRNLFLIPDL